MTYSLVGHLVRRGVEEVHEHYNARQQYIQKLEQDAELYENVGLEVQPYEVFVIAFTALWGLLMIWSIHYTIGQVMSSLAMIESPSRTAVVESAPPPYTDEKEPFIKESEAEIEPADIEVTVIEHKPITTSIRTTIHHLHRIGGFRARWRGLGLKLFYNFLHCGITNFFSHTFNLGLGGEAFVYVFVSLGLARVHMAWTHKMITTPTNKWWFQRLPARRECKALLLPTLVYAIAQQATHILPFAVAYALGLIGPEAHQARVAMAENGCPREMAMHLLRLLAVPATYILVGLAVLFPASVTLTRIEATLLPADTETIVPFDKAAIVGELDLAAATTFRSTGGPRFQSLFLQAWRSFDKASRLRLVKLYVKMVFAQIMMAVLTVHLMIAELYVLGVERMAIFFKSAAAQIKLMAIEAHKARMEGN